jgi:hypothetical protein
MHRFFAALFLLTLLLVFAGCTPSDMVANNSQGGGGPVAGSEGQASDEEGGFDEGGDSDNGEDDDSGDDGGDGGFDENGFDENGFDENGFDENGFDENGFDENGYDENGYDENGFDENGFDENGFDENGFDENGFDENGFDENGFDENGFDEDGFDEDGYDMDGYDMDGYDMDGYDMDGYDMDGNDMDGNPREGDGGGGGGGGASRRPERKPPETYAEAALIEFEEGRQQKAMEYLYAHVLLDDQAASNMKLHWFPAGKRPTMALRWAVGITFKPARQYNGLPAEFGKPVPKLMGNPRQPSSVRIEGASAPKEPENAAQAMQVFTGSFGKKVLERIALGVKTGEYGDVLRIAPAVSPQARGGRGEDDFGNDDFGGGDDDFGGGGDDDFGGGGDDFGGGGDDFGGGGDDFGGGGDDFGGGDGGGGERKRTGPIFTGYLGDTPSLAQGISFIGVGNKEQLLERVKRDRAEVLLVFDVSSLIAGKGLLNTAIELKLYDAVKGTELYKSQSVNNLQASFAKGKKDPVGQALEGLFRYVEQQVRVQPMPQLRPEHAVGRVETLVSSTQLKPLSTLAEILYYYKQGLLSREQLTEYYGKLIGPDDGKDLALGSPEERKAVLEGLLHGGDAAPKGKEGEKSAPPTFFGS